MLTHVVNSTLATFSTFDAIYRGSKKRVLYNILHEAGIIKSCLEKTSKIIQFNYFLFTENFMHKTKAINEK
jgi:hypothetical protein